MKVKHYSSSMDSVNAPSNLFTYATVNYLSHVLFSCVLLTSDFNISLIMRHEQS